MNPTAADFLLGVMDLIDPRIDINPEVAGGVAEAIGMNLDSSDDDHTVVAKDATAMTSTTDDTVVVVGVSGRSLTMCKGRGKNKKNARNPNEGALGSDGTAGAGADTTSGGKPRFRDLSTAPLRRHHVAPRNADVVGHAWTGVAKPYWQTVLDATSPGPPATNRRDTVSHVGDINQPTPGYVNPANANPIEQRVGRGNQAHRDAMAERFRRFEREVAGAPSSGITRILTYCRSRQPRLVHRK